MNDLLFISSTSEYSLLALTLLSVVSINKMAMKRNNASLSHITLINRVMLIGVLWSNSRIGQVWAFYVGYSGFFFYAAIILELCSVSAVIIIITNYFAGMFNGDVISFFLHGIKEVVKGLKNAIF
jgi:hypothetical protein